MALAAASLISLVTLLKNALEAFFLFLSYEVNASLYLLNLLGLLGSVLFVESGGCGSLDLSIGVQSVHGLGVLQGILLLSVVEHD